MWVAAPPQLQGGHAVRDPQKQQTRRTRHFRCAGAPVCAPDPHLIISGQPLTPLDLTDGGGELLVLLLDTQLLSSSAAGPADEVLQQVQFFLGWGGWDASRSMCPPPNTHTITTKHTCQPRPFSGADLSQSPSFAQRAQPAMYHGHASRQQVRVPAVFSSIASYIPRAPPQLSCTLPAPTTNPLHGPNHTNLMLQPKAPSYIARARAAQTPPPSAPQ